MNIGEQAIKVAQNLPAGYLSCEQTGRAVCCYFVILSYFISIPVSETVARQLDVFDMRLLRKILGSVFQTCNQCHRQGDYWVPFSFLSYLRELASFV